MSDKKDLVMSCIIGSLGIIILLLTTFITPGELASNILLFIILLALEIMIERIHIRIGDLTVTLDTVIILTTYMALGIKATLWVILIVRLINEIGVARRPFTRFYFNLGMFIMMFSLPHFIFQMVGYHLNDITGIINKALFILYSLLTFFINWLLIYINVYFTQRKYLKSLKETFAWDFASNIIVIPLSILFVYTYKFYSYIGILIFSLIIAFSILAFRLFRNLVFMNNELKVVQNVAASISSRLNIEETTKSILEGINELVDSDYCSIIKLNKPHQQFLTLDSIARESVDINNDYIDNYLTKNVESILTYRKSFIIDNLKKEKAFINIGLPSEINSLIYEPMLLENQMYGCILIGSKEIGKFTKMHLNIIDILSNQAVIAMENARLYNEAQNRAIIDRLTGLYNQRYFFEALDFITNKCAVCKRAECISCNKTSLIIFDIDFFKTVNDTYGHQTGDSILSAIAKIIKENVRSNDIVSRYGGEEFTVILPNTNQEKAFQIAERVRLAVEKNEFHSKNGDKIKITVSGGISEYPISADSSSTLLAYADRAMYIGSKQKGRNKVSVYAN